MPMSSKKHINLNSATAIVIANMIGTGVFTSLGFQLLGISSFLAIMLLWFVGGIIALCGALVYGELGAAMPRSGGEYHYLSKLYHPAVGYASGWISTTVGFSAPVALAAMTLGKYSADVFPGLNETWVAVIVVSVITFIHATQLEKGIGFQNWATSVKVVLVVTFIACGFFVPHPQPLAFTLTDRDTNDIFSSAFAVSLIYVSYSYSGWNASAYLTGEMKNPKRDLPWSLFLGTGIVMILYLLLNFIFLYTAPIPQLAGKLDVGYIAAEHIFSTTGADIMGWIIALLLVSSVSAMIIAGPRVAQSLGEDSILLRVLGVKNHKQIPVNAVLFQSAISIVLIFTSSFDQVLTLVGFSLSLFTLMTVVGVFILRYREKNATPVHTFANAAQPYRTFAYPLTPLIFIALSLWTLIYVALDKPFESLFGFGLSMVGVVLYFIDQNLKSKVKSD